MTFAALPLALLVAAIAIPPLVLLYFLKLRRQEKLVPSTLLWMNAVQDLQANAPFQRLKPNLLLFLQLLALLFILLAIAQPEWASNQSHGQRTILLIDRSASMNAPATDGGPTRLAEAKTQAMDYVDAMEDGGFFQSFSESEDVMVISFAHDAEVVSRFTSNQTQLHQAIESIQPTDGTTTLNDALELARAYATVTDPENPGKSTGPPANIIVFSDGRISDIREQVKKEKDVVYRRVGDETAERNVAILAFDAERNFANMDQISVYTRVANFRTEPAVVTLMFSVADQLLDSQPIEVPAATMIENEAGDSSTDNQLQSIVPGTFDFSFELAQPLGLVLGVEIEYADDLLSDNQAYVIIPPAKQLKIALVARQNFVVESSLGGIPFISQLDSLTGAEFERRQSEGKTDQYDVIIFDGYQPQKLLPGRYLCLGSLPPSSGFSHEGTDRKVNFPATWDNNHPLNHDVNFSQLTTSNVPMRIPDSATALVEGVNGPMVAEISANGVNAIVTPFQVVQSNWPWDPNFVLFMQNAVDYLGHLGDSISHKSFRPGESLVARLPQHATDIQLVFPRAQQSRTIPLTPSDPSYTTYDPIEYVGQYEMKWKEPGSDEVHSRAFAVNLFNLEESDIRSASTIEFQGDAEATMADEGSLRKRPLWSWFLIACLFVLTLEWWVYGRRAYV